MEWLRGSNPCDDGSFGRAAVVALALTGLVAYGCSDSSESAPDAAAADTEEERDVSPDTDSEPVELRIDALSAPATVRFDASGVLHVECATNLDCFRVQGYFHSQHRFFEMDLIRRRTLGELTRVFGAQGLESDKKSRHFLTTSTGEPLEDAFYEGLDKSTKDMFRAYTSGVNAWLSDWRNGEHDATLTEEYEFPLVDTEAIRDWTPRDSVALYLQLAYRLGQKSEDDLFRGRLAADLPAGAATDLLTPKPGVTSNILQASGVAPMDAFRGKPDANIDPVDRMRRIGDRLGPADRALERAHRSLTELSFSGDDPWGGGGSNNWAVTGNKTANGAALMANDPHVTLNNPSLWYYVELNSTSRGTGDLHVAGASIPSVPGVVAGHNENIAWGITTARYDLADAYVEELTDDGDAVMHEGNRVELLRKEFTFELPDGSEETETFEWVPHHGPLISKDPENNRGVSVRWAAQEGGEDLEFIQGLMSAENLGEAEQALEKLNVINTSWVLASKSGNIGWYPETRLPKRPWVSTHPNWLPVPGGGEAEWNGFVETEKLPDMTNPPKGFIATANNDFDGSYSDGDPGNDGHTPWQSPPAYGHRHQRIVDLLEEGGDEHTVETMENIQSDTYSLHGELLVPHLVDAAERPETPLSSGARKVLDVLEAWGYECPTGLDGIDPEEARALDDPSAAREAVGCAAFHVLLPDLTQAVFGDELDRHTDIRAAAYWYHFQSPLLYIFRDPGELEEGTAYFDDVQTSDETEAEAQTVRSALQDAFSRLESLFDSSDPDDWRWGRIHTVTLRSFFSQAGIDNYNYGPFANDGGFYTVDVATPWGRDGEFDGAFGHPFGPSTRMVVEAGEDGMRAYFQLPGGQDLHRESRWYNNLLEDWLANQSRRLYFEPSQVDEAAVESLKVGPEGTDR